MLMLPSCREVQENMTEYLEGALPLHRRIGFRLHLLICRACDALRRMLLALPRVGRKALEPPAQAAPEAEEAFGLAMKRIRESRRS